MDSTELKRWLISQGPAVAGVADLEPLSGYPTLPENLLAGFRRGVSMGIPIPASRTLDRVSHRGNLSHKAVARLAGLGWIGKNILLVNPEYGPRLRFATVLTDLDLEADEPLDRDCGGCSKCRDACPAGAIRGVIAKPYPETREECVDLEACSGKLKEFASELGKDICGVCIRACPFARV